MSALTTHILDTSIGRPASGVVISLYRNGEVAGGGITNADGRTDGPLLQTAEFLPGLYSIRFAVGDYFRDRGVELQDPPFLDAVAIDFGVADPRQHYHVPLLVSPFGYTTYRGS